MAMALLTTANRRFLTAVCNLLYSNPFLTDVVAFERDVLGKDFVDEGPVWSMLVSDPDRLRTNTWRIVERLQPVLKELRQQLAEGSQSHEKDLLLYEDALLYYFYYQYYPRMVAATFRRTTGGKPSWAFYNEFRHEWQHFFNIPGVKLPTGHQPAHIFAGYYQVVRAFHHIFEQIIGSSLPAARLRGGGMAIRVHARYEAIQKISLRSHERVRNPHHRTLRDRQRAGGPFDCHVTVRALRRDQAMVSGRPHQAVFPH